jgi:hypothetical protein
MISTVSVTTYARNSFTLKTKRGLGNRSMKLGAGGTLRHIVPKSYAYARALG